ncbi:CapA family protein [Vibrio fluvialis]|uniref:CapA family protein n=1 Tax=Vibrio fluvialis TaxID=676 RepID=UPI001C9D01C6|nr:CapA family protein [Vibrio fluvialis]MBY7901768.1 CapA family protein [Vibrio fluvialis]MBY7940799.1 CapA family protein [Vibrio fluvialis]MBY8167397.1 CapA family protein [Vibrio fluvialis]MBY8232523.1 CapA family protein [Vibrio fluvialis]
MKPATALFMGDFAPVADYNDITLEKKEAVFGDVLDEIRKADFSFINLECPLTTAEQALSKSGPNIKANPGCVAALSSFSLVGMANNHALDFGREGLQETLNALDSAGLKHVGAGLNQDAADKIFYQEVGGKVLAVIALCEREFSQYADYDAGASAIDPVENFYRLQEAKEKADYVFMTMHCGHEYFPLPRPELRKLCQYYVDLGADGVLCHHPHVPGAYETYKGKPIVYSMGNTVFGRLGSLPSDWRIGYAVSIRLEADLPFEIIPYCLDDQEKALVLLKGDERDAFIHRMEGYASLLLDEQAWLTEWRAFVARKTDEALIQHFFPFQFKGLGRLVKSSGVLPKLCRSTAGYKKLNQIRCESHRELLIQAFKNKQ